MRLRDLSLKKKLLMTNALMIVIPITVLIAIGAALLGGLRHAGSLQQQALALLWPEEGQTLSVQVALSSLRAASEKRKFKLHDVAYDIHVLESAGVRVLVVSKEKDAAYLTPDSEPDGIARMVARKCGVHGSALSWDMDGLVFRYEGLRSGTVIMGVGDVPMMRGDAPLPIPHEMRDFILNAALILLILMTSAGILLLGRYLARLLSTQILTPLAELRRAAAAIQRGDLSHALPPMGHDEVGATCRAFDEMRQDLARARAREAEEESRRRALFIGILHDIATPLTAVKGYASGILDGIATTPEKQHTYAERISQAAATMEGLTTRLREFLRLDTGELPLTWETVSARDLLTEYIRTHAPALAEDGVHIAMEEANTAARIRIDRGEFARVLKNLWENSGKYRRGAEVHIRISLSEEGRQLVIRCDDDGTGVRSEELPKLFDSFYRTDAARTNVAAGSGLGLAIVRRIMTIFGGSVHAEESPAGGLRIVLLLPIADEGDMT